MTANSLPHLKPVPRPPVMPEAPLSDIFKARAVSDPTPEMLARESAANHNFAETREKNDAIRAQNAANAAARDRYERFERMTEDSYRNRGLESDLDRMSSGTRKGVIEFASKAHQIHEAADAARADIAQLGQSLQDDVSDRFDKLIARIA